AEKSGSALPAPPAGASGQARPLIPRGPDRPRYPLSIAQSVQWFAAEMSDSTKPAEILKLDGPLDRPALRSAISRLVDRHEALRTAFLEIAGEPAQTIHETVEMDCPEEDLSRLDEAARTRRVRLLLREAARPFDLSQPPLLRARLLRLQAESHLLLLNLPHIVSDGWSEQLLLRELAGSYNAFRAGLNPPLSLPRVRFVDVAAWQNEQLATPALAAQREFWLERFRDGGPTLSFPAEESPRPAADAAATDTAVATLILSPELTLETKRLSSSRGATLFMVVLAAFKTLLARWTGQTDLVVGSVLAARSHPDLEDLVGVFINTLALRSDLSGNPAFSMVLERVRRTTLEAIAHQDYPFHTWLEILRRQRRQSDYLPFSALFVLHQKPSLAPFDGLAASYLLHHEITGE